MYDEGLQQARWYDVTNGVLVVLMIIKLFLACYCVGHNNVTHYIQSENE